MTLDLLHDLAALAKKHDLIKKGAALSLVCPEAKLRIPESQMEEPEDGPGAKCITIDGITFRISVIGPKDRPKKDQSLLAKEFALYRAGVYDMAAIMELPWTDYRPFVLSSSPSASIRTCATGLTSTATSARTRPLSGIIRTIKLSRWIMAMWTSCTARCAASRASVSTSSPRWWQWPSPRMR